MPRTTRPRDQRDDESDSEVTVGDDNNDSLLTGGEWAAIMHDAIVDLNADQDESQGRTRRKWRLVIWTYCRRDTADDDFNFPLWAASAISQATLLRCLAAEFGEEYLTEFWLEGTPETKADFARFLNLDNSKMLSLYFGASSALIPGASATGRTWANLYNRIKQCDITPADFNGAEWYGAMLDHFAQINGYDLSTAKGRKQCVFARIPNPAPTRRLKWVDMDEAIPAAPSPPPAVVPPVQQPPPPPLPVMPLPQQLPEQPAQVADQHDQDLMPPPPVQLQEEQQKQEEEKKQEEQQEVARTEEDRRQNSPSVITRTDDSVVAPDPEDHDPLLRLGSSLGGGRDNDNSEFLLADFNQDDSVIGSSARKRSAAAPTEAPGSPDLGGHLRKRPRPSPIPVLDVARPIVAATTPPGGSFPDAMSPQDIAELKNPSAYLNSRHVETLVSCFVYGQPGWATMPALRLEPRRTEVYLDDVPFIVRTPEGDLMEKVAFAVNVGGTHWVLAVADIERQKAQVYDSLNWDYSIAKARDILSRVGAAAAKDGVAQFTVEAAKGPQQNDAVNCGVFACALACLLSCGQPIPATLDARLWRAAFAALLSGITLSLALADLWPELFAVRDDIMPDPSPHRSRATPPPPGGHDLAEWLRKDADAEGNHRRQHLGAFARKLNREYGERQARAGRVLDVTKALGTNARKLEEELRRLEDAVEGLRVSLDAWSKADEAPYSTAEAKTTAKNERNRLAGTLKAYKIRYQFVGKAVRAFEALQLDNADSLLRETSTEYERLCGMMLEG